MRIYCGNEEIASKLFNTAGSYTVENLAASTESYRVVFSAYGSDSNTASFSATFDLETNEIVAPTGKMSNDDNDKASSITMSYEDAVAGIEANYVGTEDTVDWYHITGLATGVRTLNFALDGDSVAVAIYNSNLKSLASFNVTDKVAADGIDYSRSLKVSSDTEFFVKVAARGAESDYSITIA
jgi:hypothetical protein